MRMRRASLTLVLLLSAVALLVPSFDGSIRASSGMARALNIAPAVTGVQLEPVLSSLSSSLFVTNAHDGSYRLFIVEQGGVIRVAQPGAASSTVFLDITSRVMSGGEQGLLGLAFHPFYKNNGRFFVNYTRKPDGATVVAEYRVSTADPSIASTNEMVLLTIPQPFANHNGGMVEFGRDGFLYIGMGDGGSGNDPGNRAQNINELLGKLLRIDVDHANGTTPIRRRRTILSSRRRAPTRYSPLA